MADAGVLIPFLLMSLALELTPGPNMAWLALVSATSGRRVGLAAVSGIALGLAVQGALAAAGVAALLLAWPLAYRGLQLAGVAFLLYLAWDSWRDASDPAHHRPGGGESGVQGFGSGLITNLLNPKAALFYIAVLPGFLPQGAGVAAGLVLTAVYVAVATAVHLAIALAAGGMQGWLANPAVSARMHRLQAVALVVVAVWVLAKG